jgi:2-keto-4-pentenoate hydratase
MTPVSYTQTLGPETALFKPERTAKTVTVPAPDAAAKSAAPTAASLLVAARLEARALPGFPGALPTTHAEAYDVQEAAIALWPDEVAGWKIGRDGAVRLAGPVFRRLIQKAEVGPVPFPVFAGGFAAVEAEYVFRVAADVPAGKSKWSIPEASNLVATIHIGIETAGSPMAMINDIGGAAVISDFGNNHGLILGPEIANWRSRAPEDFHCETFIDGKSVGKGGAASLPGGPMESFRFLLEHCGKRGRALKENDLVSTGAVTGVHGIGIGQKARADFGRDGQIECFAVKASPYDPK